MVVIGVEENFYFFVLECLCFPSKLVSFPPLHTITNRLFQPTTLQPHLHVVARGGCPLQLRRRKITQVEHLAAGSPTVHSSTHTRGHNSPSSNTSMSKLYREPSCLISNHPLI